MTDWKAKIIRTGEVLDIKYSTFNIKVDLSFDKDGSVSTSSIEYTDPYENVILSDGKLYKRDDVAIGKDEFRDITIKNILQDGNEHS